jgi:hypothetical protein
MLFTRAELMENVTFVFFPNPKTKNLSQHHFGWKQVKETYNRDIKRECPETSLRLGSTFPSNGIK